MNIPPPFDPFNPNLRRAFADYFEARRKAAANRRQLSYFQQKAFFERLNCASSEAVALAWAAALPDAAFLTPSNPIPPDWARFAFRYNCPPHSKEGRGSFWQPCPIDLALPPKDAEAFAPNGLPPCENWREALRRGALRQCPGNVRTKKGFRKADAQFSLGLWIEIDSLKDAQGNALKDEALIFETMGIIRRLADRIGCEPCAVVYSGGKSLHFYFRYSSPLPIAEDAQRARHEYFHDLILAAVGGDRSIKDAAREMRTPSFWDGQRIQPTIYLNPIATFDPDALASIALGVYREARGAEAPSFEASAAASASANAAAPITAKGEAVGAADLAGILNAAPSPLPYMPRARRASIEASFERIRGAEIGGRYYNFRDCAFKIGAMLWQQKRPACPRFFLKRLIDEALKNGEIAAHFEGDAARFAAFIHDTFARGQAKARMNHDWAAEARKGAPPRLDCPGAVHREAVGYRNEWGWHLSPFNDWAAVNVITCPPSCGKSEAIAEFALSCPGRLWWVVARRALAIAASKAFEFDVYLSEGSNFQKVRGDLQTDAATQRIAIGIDSLWLIAQTSPPDVLVLDECTEVLQILIKDAATLPEAQFKSIEALALLIQNAAQDGRKVFCCDANFSDGHAQILQTLAPLTIWETPREARPFDGKRLAVIKEGDLLSSIALDIAEGRRFVAYETKRSDCQFLAFWAADIAKKMGKSFKYSVFTADNPLQDAPPLQDALFHNTTISSGVSIKSAHYERVYVIIGSYGWGQRQEIAIGARSLIQSALRARGAKEIVFVLPNYFEAVKAADSIEKEAIDEIRDFQEKERAFLPDAPPWGIGREWILAAQGKLLGAIAKDKIDGVARALQYLGNYGATFAPLDIPPILPPINWRTRCDAKRFATFAPDEVKEWVKSAQGKTAFDLKRERASEILMMRMENEPRSKHPQKLANVITAEFEGVGILQTRAALDQIMIGGALAPQTRRLMQFGILKTHDLLGLIPQFWGAIRGAINWQDGRPWAKPQQCRPLQFFPDEIPPKLIASIFRKYAQECPENPQAAIQRELRALFGAAVKIERIHPKHAEKRTRITIEIGEAVGMIDEVAPLIQSITRPGECLEPMTISPDAVALIPLEAELAQRIKHTQQQITAADLIALGESAEKEASMKKEANAPFEKESDAASVAANIEEAVGDALPEDARASDARAEDADAVDCPGAWAEDAMGAEDWAEDEDEDEDEGFNELPFSFQNVEMFDEVIAWSPTPQLCALGANIFDLPEDERNAQLLASRFEAPCLPLARDHARQIGKEIHDLAFDLQCAAWCKMGAINTLWQRGRRAPGLGYYTARALDCWCKGTPDKFENDGEAFLNAGHIGRLLELYAQGLIEDHLEAMRWEMGIAYAAE